MRDERSFSKWVHRNSATLGLAALPFVLSIAACGDSDDAGTQSASERYALTPLQDCSAIEQYAEEVAISEMELSIDGNYYYGGGPIALDNASSGAPTGAAQTNAPAMPTAAPADSASTSGRAASGTNNQESGADEPDFVKNDAELIFVVSAGKLTIVDAFPAAQTHILSRTTIEGRGLSMVRQGNRIAVLSAAPPPASIARPQAQGSLAIPAVGAPSIAQAPCLPGADCGYYGPTVTKVTLLDIANPSAPSVVRELYIEGSYQSARLIGGRLYLVTSAQTPGPTLDYENGQSDPIRFVQRAAQLKASNRELIRSQTIDAWLPRFADRHGASETHDSLGGCRNFFRPRTPLGRTILSLSALPLADESAAIEAASIVSTTGTVYASTESVYVALYLPNYSFLWRRGGPIAVAEPASTSGSSGTATTTSPGAATFALTGGASYLPPEETSLLHKFDITGAVPLYAATGEVEGHVLNQFSMDEQSGVLRVATTTDGWAIDGSRIETKNNFFNLTEQGRSLRVVGSVRGLATGERIQSARFFDNRGFIVTFRQTDPLFSLDLTDAAAPAVRSELHTTGFAQYIHPVDGGNKLLTFGQEADANGRITGLALTLVDVANLSATSQLFRSQLGQGYSDASWDHLAFNYFPPAGVLALPVQSWTQATQFSGAEVWNVSTTAGFSLRGRVDHRDLVPGFTNGGTVSPTYYGLPAVRRSVIIDRALYTISDAGLKIHSLDDLTTPLAPAISLQ